MFLPSVEDLEIVNADIYEEKCYPRNKHSPKKINHGI